MKTNITKVGFISFFQILSFAAMMQASSLPYNGPEKTMGTELTFAENKCQMKEYAGKTNKKILFLAQAENTKYLFRKDGISLQIVRPEFAVENDLTAKDIKIQSNKANQKIEFYWEGMNKDADIYGAEEVNSNVLKHMNGQNSKECENKNFRKLYYSEIYPGVDLRYYDRDNRLKYDLMIHPGFDYSDIKMRIDGVNDLFVNSNGQLIIKTTTGDIMEEAPLVLQDGKPLVAKWIITDKIVSLEIKNNDPQKELCIKASILYKGNEDYKM